MHGRFQRAAAALRDADASGLQVVCLPDFFLDHFVQLPRWRDAVEAMERVHARGGGNLPGYAQRIQPGGNAANTALALARLGASVALVARTSRFGRRYLEETLGRAGVDLGHVGDDGDLAVTTALEFEAGAPDGGGGGRRNVMLNDPGSVAAFGPEDLSEAALEAVAAADLVLVANWTLTRKGGTDLAEAVSRAAHEGGARTYVDTGDPSPRLGDVDALFRRVLEGPHVDVVGMNENELAIYAGDSAEGGEGADGADDAWRRQGARVAARLGGVLDLHTADFAASWARAGGGEPVVTPAFAVEALRATGAGDAWNAGNIVGHLLDLPAGERLAVANAVAARYVADERGAHPTLIDVARFLESRPATRGDAGDA